MMEINKHNYEEYILDYLEGNLRGDLLEAMDAFLLLHPEVLEAVVGLDQVRLEAPAVAYPAAHALRREETVPAPYTDHDAWFAAYAGGDLAPDEMGAVESFVAAHPSYRKDFEAYKHTLLVPDPSIQYPFKGDLKRSIPLFGILTGQWVRYSMATAAAISLLITAVWVGRIIDQAPQSNAPYEMAEILPDRPSDLRLPSSRQMGMTTNTILEAKTSYKNKVYPQRSASPDPVVSERRDDRTSLAMSMPIRQASAVSTAGDIHDSQPIYLFPRYQFAGPDPFYLAGSLPMADADSRSGLGSQILGWLGWGKQETSAINIDPNKVLWAMADRSVSVLNMMTDNNVQLVRSTDDQGNTLAYALVTDRFEIARKPQRSSE